MHEIQYGGMCANCGKDLTGGDYLGNAEASRATVAMSHETLGLTVSYGEAARLERETTKRLLQTSKLSLIVDLDQCVIQTTVDPTVGEWLRDESNPNHEALQDVQQFRIAEEGPRAPIYYVKPRPGLGDFLKSISKKYEMHIYTMGTKPYALKIASIIDPDGQYFGSRILSRDENGSNTQKTIQRLFPIETNMVVIMDDRGDVWQWVPNLIKVNPFEFFVGIGDINSSFLPKLAQKPSSSLDPSPSTTTASVADNPVAAPDLDAPQMEAAQAAELEAQVEARPLAKQQDALEDDGNTETRKLLKTDDKELFWLERALRKLHEEFYVSYNIQIGEVTRDRNLSKLHRTKRRRTQAIADVKSILSDQKRAVLKGVTIQFSGIIRSDLDPRREWQGQLATQFGARVLDPKSRDIPTHVVVSTDITPTNLTEKARLGKSHPWVKVVYLTWLLDSITQFTRLNERKYQVDKSAVHVDPPDESDTESVQTDFGVTDKFINEASKRMDWNEINGEMEDFLNDSDVTNSDSESLYSPLSKRRKVAKMRKSTLRDTRSSDGELDDFANELAQQLGEG